MVAMKIESPRLRIWGARERETANPEMESEEWPLGARIFGIWEREERQAGLWGQEIGTEVDSGLFEQRDLIGDLVQRVYAFTDFQQYGFSKFSETAHWGHAEWSMMDTDIKSVSAFSLLPSVRVMLYGAPIEEPETWVEVDVFIPPKSTKALRGIMADRNRAKFETAFADELTAS